MLKIAVFSAKKYDIEYFTKLNSNKDVSFVFLKPALCKETILLAKGCNAVCVFVNDDVCEETLKYMKNELNISILALRCAGFNNVKLAVAKELNIQVVRVPRYSPFAVAEHAMTLILALNRKIKRSMDRVREGNFELDGLLGFDIHGKTVGIIGTGAIGVCMVNILTGFGANILANDLYPNDLVAKMPNVKYTTVDEIYEKCDIISLHVNLMPSTFHIINNAAIDKMKKDVMIINVSRGGLLDTKAVIRGLKSGKIGYLGVDVLEHESDLFFDDHSSEIIKDDEIARLMTFNNVIITGHQAFFTVEALSSIVETTLQNITLLANGQECSNIVRDS